MAESKMPWEQAADAVCAAMQDGAAKITRRAAEEFYETVMLTVQDYLRENVEFNLSSKLQGYADTASRLRDENEQLKRRADLVEPLVEALRLAHGLMFKGPERETVRAALQAYEAAK